MVARVADDPEQERDAAGVEPSVFISHKAEVTPQDEPTDNLEVARTKIRNRTALTILELASHTLVLGLALGSIWLVHLILETLLEKDARFFNYIPISWIIDVADLLVIGKFLWEIIKDFRRD
jgi:hypothetical protein